jgi:hypothetical protein
LLIGEQCFRTLAVFLFIGNGYRNVTVPLQELALMTKVLDRFGLDGRTAIVTGAEHKRNHTGAIHYE